MPRSAAMPWGRVAVEGAAIVASILLAFGIDAWWDERQESVEEQQVLEDLQDEFVVIRQVLQEHKTNHLGRLDALAALLAELDANATGLDPDTLAAGLDDLFAPTTSDLSNGTLQALLGSGRLEIISSRALREKLVGWEGAIAEVWDDQASHVKRVYELHIPWFVAQGYGLGDVKRLWVKDDATPFRSISSSPEDMRRLLGDPSFRSMVEVNYLYKLHLTEEFDNAIAAADAILDGIASSIRPTDD